MTEEHTTLADPMGPEDPNEIISTWTVDPESGEAIIYNDLNDAIEAAYEVVYTALESLKDDGAMEIITVRHNRMTRAEWDAVPESEETSP